jgi:hypothetical protein
LGSCQNLVSGQIITAIIGKDSAGVAKHPVFSVSNGRLSVCQWSINLLLQVQQRLSGVWWMKFLAVGDGGCGFM